MAKFQFPVLCLLSGLFAATNLIAGQADVAAKKPVFGGACEICPWGAMAEVVKAAMSVYGYDVQICHNCNAADAPRIVSEARMPPPYRPDPAVPEILAPRNAPGLGTIDFGAVSIQFLRNAYRGTGTYSREKPRTNLCLIANIQDPSYMLVAAKAETGITNLSQIQEKRWPVRILTAGVGGDSARILAHYGLSRTNIEAAGGRIGNTAEIRTNFDVVIGGGGVMTTAPEWRIWTEISQSFDLKFIQLPDDLLNELARASELERGIIPRGIVSRHRGADSNRGSHRHGDLLPGRFAGGFCVSRRESDGRAATAPAMEPFEFLLQRPHRLERLRSAAASRRGSLLQGKRLHEIGPAFPASHNSVDTAERVVKVTGMLNPETITRKLNRLPALPQIFFPLLLALPFVLSSCVTHPNAAVLIPAPGSKLPAATNDIVITAADVTVEKVGTNIPASAIGEPVGGVTLSPPRWV